MIRNFINRILFRYYSFYSRIEDDDVMVFYFASFAFSAFTCFYIQMILAAGLDLLALDKFVSKEIHVFFCTILTFLFVFIFYKNKKKYLEKIQKMNSSFEPIDLFCWLYAPLAFIALFIGIHFLNN